VRVLGSITWAFGRNSVLHEVGMHSRRLIALVALTAACREDSAADRSTDRGAAVRAASTAGQVSAATLAVFVYDTTPGTTYVAEIWDTDSAAQDAVLAHARAAPPGAEPPRGTLVLRAYNGQRVVRVTRWDTVNVAAVYASAARGLAPKARYVEELEVRSVGAKPDQPLAFDSTMAAQFSQFTMRRKAPVDTLQAMAAGMSGGMVQAEPSLRLISTLTARDSSVVAFLGVWTSPTGFDIFAERKTFSAKPYWEPYAGNEHHMMAVVTASTRP
jgi:hypothetical protein